MKSFWITHSLISYFVTSTAISSSSLGSHSIIKVSTNSTFWKRSNTFSTKWPLTIIVVLHRIKIICIFCILHSHVLFISIFIFAWKPKIDGKSVCFVFVFFLPIFYILFSFFCYILKQSHTITSNRNHMTISEVFSHIVNS